MLQTQHFEDLNNNFVLKDSLNFKHQFHRQPNYLQHSNLIGNISPIHWMQYIFETFNKRSNTTQHYRQLQLTKQHLQKYDTIFHNSILLHFSAQMQQQQCNLYFKPNQKLQTTAERTNSAIYANFIWSELLIGFTQFLKMIISWQRHSSQILVRTSVKQRSILGLHKL